VLPDGRAVYGVAALRSRGGDPGGRLGLVMQQLVLKEQPWAAGTGLQAGGTPHRVTLAVEPGSLRGNEGLLDQAALGAPPGTEIEQPGDKSQ